MKDKQWALVLFFVEQLKKKCNLDPNSNLVLFILKASSGSYKEIKGLLTSRVSKVLFEKIKFFYIYFIFPVK